MFTRLHRLYYLYYLLTVVWEKKPVCSPSLLLVLLVLLVLLWHLVFLLAVFFRRTVNVTLDSLGETLRSVPVSSSSSSSSSSLSPLSLCYLMKPGQWHHSDITVGRGQSHVDSLRCLCFRCRTMRRRCPSAAEEVAGWVTWSWTTATNTQHVSMWRNIRTNPLPVFREKLHI